MRKYTIWYKWDTKLCPFLCTHPVQLHPKSSLIPCQTHCSLMQNLILNYPWNTGQIFKPIQEIHMCSANYFKFSFYIPHLFYPSGCGTFCSKHTATNTGGVVARPPPPVWLRSHSSTDVLYLFSPWWTRVTACNKTIPNCLHLPWIQTWAFLVWAWNYLPVSQQGYETNFTLSYVS